MCQFLLTEYDDTADACALKVPKEYVRYYLTLLVKDRKMCEDAEKLNKCYDLSSKSIKCNAKIIQNYASMVEDVAQSVVQLVQNHMKSLCNSVGELKATITGFLWSFRYESQFVCYESTDLKTFNKSWEYRVEVSIMSYTRSHSNICSACLVLRN